ncbi:MAG: hypothetical protein M0Z78_08225 [Betaproteobacteria bacterium]|jgi:hypothetical protein|nr:hypothetical protein [Betaproteobacteria bacterium]
MVQASLSLEGLRIHRWRWLQWLLLPLLFQAFLVVGALDPLLDSGAAVHSTSPLCSVSGQRWSVSSDSASPIPVSPSPNDIGFDHGHCPICASLAYGLPIAELSLPIWIQSLRSMRGFLLPQEAIRPPPEFTLFLSHAPPIPS